MSSLTGGVCNRVTRPVNDNLFTINKKPVQKSLRCSEPVERKRILVKKESAAVGRHAAGQGNIAATDVVIKAFVAQVRQGEACSVEECVVRSKILCETLHPGKSAIEIECQIGINGIFPTGTGEEHSR